MSDEFEEHEGLIDEDPALDFILYKEMEKEDSKGQKNNNSGCCVLFFAVGASVATIGWGITSYFV